MGLGLPLQQILCVGEAFREAVLNTVEITKRTFRCDAAGRSPAAAGEVVWLFWTAPIVNL